MKLKCAIIGLGQIASRYDEDKKRKGIVTHAAAINARRDCELVAGVDLNNKQRQLFRKRYPKVKVYSNTRELFRNEQIDLLIIATPPQSRYESIKLAVHHRIKGLIIEKPLAANLKEGKLIYQLLKKSKIPVAINFSRRYDRMHQQLARDIKNKRWGQVLSADAYYSTSHESHGAHIMDELRMLFGSSSGVHIHFIKNYLIYEIDIYFSKARLRITSSGFKTEFWKVSHSPQFSGFKCLVPSKTPYPKGYQHVMENLYDNAVGMIRKKSKPLCSIEDGLESLKMIDAILRKNH